MLGVSDGPVSPPVTESDMRRWADPVHWPEPRPLRSGIQRLQRKVDGVGLSRRKTSTGYGHLNAEASKRIRH